MHRLCVISFMVYLLAPIDFDCFLLYSFRCFQIFKFHCHLISVISLSDETIIRGSVGGTNPKSTNQILVITRKANA